MAAFHPKRLYFMLKFKVQTIRSQNGLVAVSLSVCVNEQKEHPQIYSCDLRHETHACFLSMTFLQPRHNCLIPGAWKSWSKWDQRRNIQQSTKIYLKRLKNSLYVFTLTAFHSAEPGLGTSPGCWPSPPSSLPERLVGNLPANFWESLRSQKNPKEKSTSMTSTVETCRKL